jgi:transcriptional regulator with XRE-family HTH domain
MSNANIAARLRANLVALREKRTLTQAELGARAKIAAASISHFETGQRQPSLDSLVKLADALDTSIDGLLGRANVGGQIQVDPIFLRASQSSAEKLDTLKRITAALLADDSPK